jgi:hypothetical protein
MRDYSKWKEDWEKDQENRRLCFARFCWVRKYELTPSKKCTWQERFEEMEGISLSRYAGERMRERSRKEKQESRSK